MASSSARVIAVFLVGRSPRLTAARRARLNRVRKLVRRGQHGHALNHSRQLQRPDLGLETGRDQRLVDRRRQLAD